MLYRLSYPFTRKAALPEGGSADLVSVGSVANQGLATQTVRGVPEEFRVTCGALSCCDAVQWLRLGIQFWCSYTELHGKNARDAFEFGVEEAALF